MDALSMPGSMPGSLPLSLPPPQPPASCYPNYPNRHVPECVFQYKRSAYLNAHRACCPHPYTQPQACPTEEEYSPRYPFQPVDFSDLKW